MAKNNQNIVSDSDTEKNAEAIENSTVNPETETAAVTTAKVKYEGITTFAYIGPSLPDSRLKTNTVLSGTYAEITEYYKDAITVYPSVARLIVPVAQLAESSEKTRNSGNIMYNYYMAVIAEIKLKGAEQ